MRHSAAMAAAGLRFPVGGAFLALFLLWSIWAVRNIGPSLLTWQKWNKPATGDPNTYAVNEVNARYCGDVSSSRKCDPVDPTFYDDPTVSFSIERPMKNWDEKRSQWLDHHPSYAVGLTDRILVVTGSQPYACPHPSGDHFMLRFFKNKVDYCRRHGYEIFYNNVVLSPKMGGCWAKIQAIRSAMMAHPESEWILWIDSDAAFTDMDFKVPLARYRAHNLVVHSWTTEVYESWVSANAGVFLIRNCQWAIEFLDAWAQMGPQSENYEEWGRIQTSTFKDKPFPASDDQSGMIYMLLKNKKWGSKAYIENKYSLHGYWIAIVGGLENVSRKYEEAEKRWRGLGRRHAEVVGEHYGELWGPRVEDVWRRPFVTHFTGCQPCNGNHNPEYAGDSCWDGMKMALNFADNQVIRTFGFVHKSLMDNDVVPL